MSSARFQPEPKAPLVLQVSSEVSGLGFDSNTRSKNRLQTRRPPAPKMFLTLRSWRRTGSLLSQTFVGDLEYCCINYTFIIYTATTVIKSILVFVGSGSWDAPKNSSLEPCVVFVGGRFRFWVQVVVSYVWASGS